MDRTDPANGVVEPTEGVVPDRDFSAGDFRETRKPPPPPPPSCPDGQVGTPPNCAEPKSELPMFEEEYAPRAAVYEAFPDFLLRLTGQGPSRTCGSVPDEPVWVRFAGGQGSYEADRSTTGATYNLERFETEGGLSAAFNDTTKGWVSVRHVWGAAGIGSPTGGGQIDVRGLGSSVGGAWQSATGAYAKGCFSYMAYNVDFASNQRGLLKAGTNGRGYTLDVEAGWRFALTGQVQLTPRVWVVGSRVTVNSFTDAVDARVSFADADRVSGGLGLMADTTRPWGEGEFVLQGLGGRGAAAQRCGDPRAGVGRATERGGHGTQPAVRAERGLSPRPLLHWGGSGGPPGVGLRRQRIRRLPQCRPAVLTFPALLPAIWPQGRRDGAAGRG